MGLPRFHKHVDETWCQALHMEKIAFMHLTEEKPWHTIVVFNRNTPKQRNPDNRHCRGSSSTRRERHLGAFVKDNTNMQDRQRYEVDGLPLNPLELQQLIRRLKATASETQLEDIQNNRPDYLPYYTATDGTVRSTWTEGTAGRIYSTGPCLQNVRGILRSAFSAPGKLVISADWSASHLRILATHSRDKQLTKDILENDPYERLRDDLGVKPGVCADAARKAVKTALIATMNSQGDEATASTLAPYVVEGGKSLRDVFATRYPDAEAYLGGLRKAYKAGTLETPTGTPVKVPDAFRAPAYWLQATEAEALKWILRESGVKPCLLVHDEIVVLTTPEGADEDLIAVMRAMKDSTVAVGSLSPELAADCVKITVGPSWGEQYTPDHPDARKAPEGRAVTRSDWFDIAWAWLVDPKLAPTETERYALSLWAYHNPEEAKAKAYSINKPRSDARRAYTALLRDVKGISAHIKNKKAFEDKLAQQRAEELGELAAARELAAKLSSVPNLPSMTPASIGQYLFSTYKCMRTVSDAFGQTSTWVLQEDNTWSMTPKVQIARAALRLNGMPCAIGTEMMNMSFISPDAVARAAIVASVIDDDKFMDACHAPMTLPFTNGVIPKPGAALRPIEIDDMVRSDDVIQFDYDPLATCPNWLQLLNNVFDGHGDTADRIALYQEHIGVSLFGQSTRYRTHLIFLGPEGSNGKSTLSKVLSSVLPSTWIGTVSPIMFSRRFGVKSLLRARLNIPTEVGDIEDLAKMKGALSGDPMTEDYKGASQVDVVYRCGHHWACNELPKIAHDDAFLSRFITLKVDNVFVHPHKYNPQNPKHILINLDLLDAALGEAPGILAWCVEGARRFAANGNKYTRPASADAPMQDWRAQNPIVAFFTETLVCTTTGGMGRDELYNHYRDWCVDSGIKYPYTKQKFARDFGARCVKSAKVTSGPLFNKRIYPVAIMNAANAPKAGQVLGFTNAPSSQAAGQKYKPYVPKKMLRGAFDIDSFKVVN